MRLIDADALLQEFETENVAHNSDMWHITGIKAFIENQPTAFNLDAVVEKLEQCIQSYVDKVQYEVSQRAIDELLERVQEVEKCIDIVRNGGKE